ncbi:MAG: DUF4115 domain-containing protein [Acidimicrobiales bacterium]
MGSKTVPVAGVAVLALAVAGAATALALEQGGSSPSPKASGTPPHKTTKQTTPPAPTLGASPTTVLPVSSSSGAATYASPSAGFTVALVATGPCWVEAKPSASSSQTTFVGTLQAGVTHTFSASGSMWLRVGYASHVQVSLDGAAVQVPGAGASPYDLTFAPTAA